MPVDTDALKARVRIEDVVQGYIGQMKKHGGDFVACCPFHAEKTPSFVVHQEAQYFKCFGCGAKGDVIEFVKLYEKCDFNAAVEKLGGAATTRPAPAPRQLPAPAATAANPSPVFATQDLLNKAVAYHAHSKGGKVVARFYYPDGLIIYRVELPPKDCKKRGKYFTQCHAVEGGFAYGGIPRSQLYHVEELKDAPVVIIVEGEVKADKLRSLGFPATCSAGGSSAAAKTDWKPLAGKTAIFWRDNDAPGEKFQADVLAILNELHPRPQVSIIPVNDLGLPPGGDVVDFIAKYVLREEAVNAIKCALQTAVGIGALADFERETLDTLSGVRSAIDFPWERLSNATLALMPGTLTILAGPAGNTKSIMLLWAFMHWLKNGIRGAVLELEDSVCFHMRRAQALFIGNSKLTNTKWLRANPVEAQEAYEKSREFLRNLTSCVCALPRSTPTTVENILAWVRTQAVQGVRIIAIDPVTDADLGKDFWSADRKYVNQLNSLAEEFQVSIIAVTHPRKFAPDIEKVTLDDMANTAAWGRSCQTALWLGYHDMQEDIIITSLGRSSFKYNRTLRILKARNSGGRDITLALHFDPATLRTTELGELEK